MHCRTRSRHWWAVAARWRRLRTLLRCPPRTVTRSVADAGSARAGVALRGVPCCGGVFERARRPDVARRIQADGCASDPARFGPRPAARAREPATQKTLAGDEVHTPAVWGLTVRARLHSR